MYMENEYDLIMQSKKEALRSIVENYNCEIRMRYHAGTYSSWNKYIIFPEQGYVEIDGPVRLDEVAYLEINTVSKTRIGKLVSDKIEHNLDKVKNELTRCGIDFSAQGDIIKIYPNTL